MEDKEIRIKIDPNGNIQREVVDRSPPEEKKTRFLRKIISVFPM